MTAFQFGHIATDRVHADPLGLPATSVSGGDLVDPHHTPWVLLQPGSLTHGRDIVYDMPASDLNGHLPVGNGRLRASDADRDQVAAVLTSAYAEGRLTRDELDERVALAMQAKTFNDLLPLTEDLVPHPAAAATPALRSETTYQIDRQGADTAPDTMVAVFSGVTRNGPWRVRRRTQALAIFGGIDLDLRNATFEDDVVEITGFWCFGGLDIKVPEGMQVRDHTAGVLGGTDIKYVGEPQPGAPTLVLKGLTLFGGVSVRGPKPPKLPKRR